MLNNNRPDFEKCGGRVDALSFPQLEVQKKTGKEQFCLDSRLLPITLLDFWRWAASDLISNITRGILAEYIVASALGCTEDVRLPWEAFDLLTSKGVRVEVKSAAYLQTWHHKALSRISFDIRAARVWDAETNTLGTGSERPADIYVFCILAHTDKASLDPLNLDQWTFWLLPSNVLNTKALNQKTISLPALLKLKPVQATYDTLSAVIEQLADGL